MLFKTLSAAVFGIDAYVVDVEVDLTPRAGDSMTPAFTIVGLPDVATLQKVVELINDQTAIAPLKVDTEVLLANLSDYAEDFREVRGQAHAKRAIEVATAGAHNIILIGPPGSGKTMLAKRMPTILPPLEFEESLECTKIH